MNSRILALAVVVVLILTGMGMWFYQQGDITVPGGISCTAEALLCPDGSGVGRTGASCAFSPCSNVPSLTGELMKDPSGFRLIMQSPDQVSEGATYAMPLIVGADIADALVGKRVTVSGSFTEGATMQVTDMHVASEGGDAHVGTIGMGETKLISGVKITLNKVVQDSRCPTDVVCIQAGAITANVTLLSDTDHETWNMASDEVPHAFDAFQISITHVSPARLSKKETAQSEYKVTFRVDPLTASGIRGSVSLGPTCPVERTPPDPACADKPYKTDLVLTSANGSRVIKTFSSKSDGTFAIDVTSGEYQIRPAPTSSPLPRCATVAPIYVRSGEITNVTVSCDSGIR